MGKVGDKVSGLCHGHKSRKSATQIIKVGDMICAVDFHDLCPRQSLRLCRKVGIMEFGLKSETVKQKLKVAVGFPAPKLDTAWLTSEDITDA